jgi:Putative transposase/Transposase zinc-binding domain
MNKITRIVRRFASRYLERYADRMLPGHRRALADITACRTASMGAHLYRCDHCNQVHDVYHSCRNRVCPACQKAATRHWIAARKAELPKVDYFHLVFTVPGELRRFIRSHQRILINILFKAASRSLMQLTRDPKYIDATLGIVAVLHTWSRAMAYHPHIHCIVTGGGYDPITGSWRHCHPHYLVPVKALSAMFRGKFMAYAQKALPDAEFPACVWNKPWVIYSKPAFFGTSKLLKYLGRYVRQVAITEKRIIEDDNNTVAFMYFDDRKKQKRKMALDGIEFLRRYLQHVLPKGFHKVRYYGIFAPSNRRLLNELKSSLEEINPIVPQSVCEATKKISCPAPTLFACPYCKKGTLFLMAVCFRQYRAPPLFKHLLNDDLRLAA